MHLLRSCITLQMSCTRSRQLPTRAMTFLALRTCTVRYGVCMVVLLTTILAGGFWWHAYQWLRKQRSHKVACSPVVAQATLAPMAVVRVNMYIACVSGVSNACQKYRGFKARLCGGRRRALIRFAQNRHFPYLMLVHATLAPSGMLTNSCASNARTHGCVLLVCQKHARNTGFLRGGCAGAWVGL